MRDGRPLIRRRLDAGGLAPWGQDGADDVGAVLFPEFDPREHIEEVSIGLYGTDGNPIETFGAIEAFFLRWRDAKRWRTESRTAANWLLMRSEAIQRSTLGGFAEDSDQPREAQLTNFGQGWTVGHDWADDAPPTLVVMWRYSSNEARPQVEVAYRKEVECRPG